MSVKWLNQEAKSQVKKSEIFDAYPFLPSSATLLLIFSREAE